jgi:membrane-associated protease RseP (regulator of RpoE activity)
VVPPDRRPPARPVSGGWLGALLENAPVDSRGARPAGAIVLSVEPGGPVAIAGLLPGDRVFEYGGTAVKDVADLVRLAGANAPRDSVVIRVRRESTARTLEMIVGARATEPVTAASVVVYYAADDDQKTAEDLAAELRKSINDPRYTIRTLKTSRIISREGEVRYSSSELSTLAGSLVRSAGSWLSRTYGRRVAVTPLVDPRISARSVVVVVPGKTSAPAIPGRTSAPAVPLRDPVITVFYPTVNDARTAEDLADYLRTRRSGLKYSVLTKQMRTSNQGSQIEYDNERTGELARALARDIGAWISRSYGRRVALEPTLNGRIGADAVVVWLPSR